MNRSIPLVLMLTLFYFKFSAQNNNDTTQFNFEKSGLAYLSVVSSAVDLSTSFIQDIMIRRYCLL